MLPPVGSNIHQSNRKRYSRPPYQCHVAYVTIKLCLSQPFNACQLPGTRGLSTDYNAHAPIILIHWVTWHPRSSTARSKVS